MRLPDPIRRAIARRVLRMMATRKADYVIESGTTAYLCRWYIIPRNPLISVYAHWIRVSDDDRAMHDHRSVTISIILDGGYIEVTPREPQWADPNQYVKRQKRSAGDIIARMPRSLHRLEVPSGCDAITLFITGPWLRVWGFHTAVGWLTHKEYFRIFGERQS